MGGLIDKRAVSPDSQPVWWYLNVKETEFHIKNIFVTEIFQEESDGMENIARKKLLQYVSSCFSVGEVTKRRDFWNVDFWWVTEKSKQN